MSVFVHAQGIKTVHAGEGGGVQDLGHVKYGVFSKGEIASSFFEKHSQIHLK